ncbi:PTS system mannose/fructose/N-acetylgalactosamine-transporter subunit IIB [Lentilactobacillus parafarraginis]|jgi:PTS system fructose-specific IIB component/PTS system mannose-specific IIB component|uniref:Fructose-specific phosphotransferase enzyme IIB component n=3 Tax=Lentilactobacillus parafarraginis TaxID=390842 RepID=A0A0R1YSG4_9LACO|nr:PTS sugar transporter subunit IIB [Lentilactobacillus parafarraginis]EHL99540.1 putative fructose-specific phosphotransferase enzyme IIB component [Lentilactobacillus parafarraginis F0439]KRM45213.1 fructose-specific phosphotransferase enzyme IIB component [Lentilactobacillus parafarraginis DSM 18390 = JCM 14109]TLQ16672.1 PTS system mannose/fructose/N-acetylgalactosamine-transporter subunit IIB [Lentilactobacillus parafarraginis]
MTMDIRLARVDSRLLHGQVATFWTRFVQPNRIMVVSDSVAKDNLRKTLITQVAPPGVKANVVSVNKMIRAYFDSRFDSFNTLLLTENVGDMLRLAEGGVDFSQVGINIGSIAYTEGMTMITDAVAMDDHTAKQVAALVNDFHLDVTAQKIPADKKIDLLSLIKKKNFNLE